MRRAWAIVAMGLGLLVADRPVVGQEITAQKVRTALENGVRYLKSRQLPDGAWPDSGDIIKMTLVDGTSALCTLALLNAGVETGDPVIQRSLEHIRRSDVKKTYVVALQTMVLCRAEPEKNLSQIRRNVNWLQAKQLPEGANKGGWSYPTGDGDPSNSQFALLALFEAEQAGVEVSLQTWRLAKMYWENIQNPDGSWSYRPRSQPTGSMTCAGIASLVITDDRIHPPDAVVNGDRIECCSRGQAQNDRLVRSLLWMEKNFRVSGNPAMGHGLVRLPGANKEIDVSRLWHYYYLYGLERVGRMTARRFFGAHDWYREGCDYLVRQQRIQQAQDYWVGIFPGEDDPLIATSLAVLFLAKGQRPLILAKLKHTATDDWNQHRNDVANMTRYVEHGWKRELNWQVVDLKPSTVDDLVQTPVLYLSGTQSPLPAGENEQRALAQKLRDYLDRGGFLLAEACCGGRGFDEGFRRLVELMFPQEPEYRLRLLPPEHPIWYAEEKVEPDQIRQLLGIDYGCRTSIVYVPPEGSNPPRAGLSCLWELSRPGRDQKYSPVVQAQVKAGLSIGINILAYATNRQLRDRPDVVFTPAQGKLLVDKIARGQLRVAEIQHPGGCTTAPRALANLLEKAGRELKLRISSDTTSNKIPLTDPRLFDYHLAFMHGRNNFRLTDRERQQLKTYLERGGVLFADSICASEAFSRSFRQEMLALFPDKPLQPIPSTDPLFTPTFGGFPLSTVKRRDPAGRKPGEPLTSTLHDVPPLLEAIKLDDRYAVLFSPYDLSCALEKQNSLECQGYPPDDASRIGINVLLYSLNQ